MSDDKMKSILHDAYVDLTIEVERLRLERDLMKEIAIDSLENLANELQFGDPETKARKWFLEKYRHGFRTKNAQIHSENK